MFSTHRQRRCHAIWVALPDYDSTAPGKTMRELLQALRKHYDDCKNEEAQVRTLQGDLQLMRSRKEIVCCHGTNEGTALRYRRSPQVALPVHLDDLQHGLLQQGVPQDLVREFLHRLQNADSYFRLQPGCFLTVPDTVLLTPNARPDPTIQSEIILAIRQRCVLKACYRTRGETTARERWLHPVGVMLRGPQHYLVAYDQADLKQSQQMARVYAIQRLEDVVALTDTVCALPDPSQTVEQLAKTQGLANFVQNTTPVTVKLLARGYVCTLLQENRISPNQTVNVDAQGHTAVVTFTTTLSGTLYRWLLGFGDKVEVLEPNELRTTMASQARSLAEQYQGIS
ncbi:helix-turn-helix transcriptional regulator [Candidatus Symbiobacter mobilis]|uniref:Transcriptional factor-like protein n=1 Tax=Candidatus Symbiobacter mobilis CR TaxID=946483 RepID=U5N9V3_9BURK|nr:WYL domain-containing protein [Candidatus Symbiobacter mobilis]AGX88326.1 transcriptional factor-like protein [Candidatus Symbiobacter mobilis CR]